MKTIKHLIICFYFCFSISACSSKESNELNYFDFEKEREIATLGVFKIDDISSSKIAFNPSEGDLTDKVLHDREKIEFNFNGTYKLINQKSNKSYYFKFGELKFKTHTEFSHVNWLGSRPFSSGTFKIKTVNVPFEQPGSLRVCTVGDSQIWWGYGEYLRKFMNQINDSLYFVGSNQDIFGYPHEGEGGDHTKDVVKRVDKIPVADIYTLLLGTNDYKGSLNEASENLTFIVKRLKEKNNKAKIYYVTPLPTTNTERDQFNNDLKELFLKTNKKEVEVIKLGEYIRNLDNWEKLFPDGLHANKKGYRLIASYIASEIKN